MPPVLIKIYRNSFIVTCIYENILSKKRFNIPFTQFASLKPNWSIWGSPLTFPLNLTCIKLSELELNITSINSWINNVWRTENPPVLWGVLICNLSRYKCIFADELPWSIILQYTIYKISHVQWVLKLSVNITV